MVDSILAPLRRLMNDGLFWQYQSDGLALDGRPGWWRALRVPLDLPELAVVADSFHISPVLPLLTGDGHFFVLALSQHQIRLLEGTRDRLEEVHLPGVPLGVRDALQGQEAPKQLQLYVADRGGVGARGIFHGHGSAGDLQKERVLRYFRKVNRALREVLAGQRAPMVLAAVEHLAPIWRQVNTYPHLADQVLAGSPAELGLQELHARAWAVVEPRFLQAQGAAAGKYHRLAGSGLTSRDPREIIRAAREGRVETLFAARPPAGVASTNGGPSPNGDRALRDVLELAAVATLLKGGSVYALPAGAAPGGGNAAAVFRYEARLPGPDRLDLKGREAGVVHRVPLAAEGDVRMHRVRPGDRDGPPWPQPLPLGLLGLLLGPIGLLLAPVEVRNERPWWTRLVASGDPGGGPVDVLVGIDGSPESAAATTAALELLGGRPATTLDTIAAEDGYDLLVVGARGAGLSRVLLGSVASRLAAGASVPVLVVGDRARTGQGERNLGSAGQADPRP